MEEAVKKVGEIYPQGSTREYDEQNPGWAEREEKSRSLFEEHDDEYGTW